MPLAPTPSELPIRRIRQDGSVDLLGTYVPSSAVLRLERPGYPLLSPGEHAIDGDLPWVFEEMAPAGFLARRFIDWYPELRLPRDRHVWSVEHVVRALSSCGHDLPGNLIVGEESFERYQRIFRSGRKPGPEREAARAMYPHFVHDILTEEAHSSVGGERPKFTLRLADGGGLLVKFSPPVDTPLGRRWADLLRMEAHCAATLRAAGIPAVTADVVEVGARAYLEVERFDRLPGGGRRGAVTWYYLGAARYGELSSAPVVARALHEEGWLSLEELRRFERVHAFSAAIGNTDTHLGNYGLLVDDEGQTSLAPIFDVLPMAFAPRHDELPDERVGRGPGSDEPEVNALVEDLAERVEADGEISAGFVKRWRAYVRR